MADSRYDELERRVLTVEEELNGEKHLTRYAVDQTLRNDEVLNALRSEVAALRADISALTLRVDHQAADMAAVKAALVMHGRALDVLQQDVRQLRSEMVSMRENAASTREEVASIREEVASIREEVASIREEVASIREEVTSIREEVTSIREEAAVRHNEVLAAIRALGSGGSRPA